MQSGGIMIIGRLKHRITLQSQKMSNDGFNTVTWVDVAKVWGEFQGISGDKIIAANAEMMKTNWKVIIRYRDMKGVTRLVYRDQFYEITAILPDNDKNMVTLLCKAGTK